MYEVESRANLTREQAFKVTIAVLQELHDRLTPKEVDQLAAQLPHGAGRKPGASYAAGDDGCAFRCSHAFPRRRASWQELIIISVRDLIGNVRCESQCCVT
jgi:uncharacterized protein (DUF2267 family)